MTRPPVSCLSPHQPGALRAAALARVLLLAPVLVLTVLASGPALAQYKVVEPGGRVTYTDRPPSYAAVPAAGGAGAVAGANTAAGEEVALSVGLPYALRQVVLRYPVRLYTASGCAPCDAARQFLQQRGVPLLEYGVNRGEDIDLLQREVGASELPVVTIGRQRLVGFAAPEWQATLEAAGYPSSSALPAGYRSPAVRPLAGTATERAQITAPNRASATRGAPPAEPAVSPFTPGGFRF